MQSKSKLSDRDMKKLEKALNSVSEVKLSYTKNFTASDVPAENFKEWVSWASSLKDPDAVRNALYYGFQPLNDLLIDQDLPSNKRQEGVELLNSIKTLSLEYLTSYYTGRPNVKPVRETIKGLKTSFLNLDGLYYSKKSRNVDQNGIFPNNILSFLNSFLEYTYNGNLFVPQYLIGCACGSSEIAFPLAGVLSIELDFIRKSKRRDDYEPKIISEQKDEIHRKILNHKIICIEDYVCSGRSLQDVMGITKKFGASEIAGASVRFSHNECDNHVKEIHESSYFHVFK